MQNIRNHVLIRERCNDGDDDAMWWARSN